MNSNYYGDGWAYPVSPEPEPPRKRRQRNWFREVIQWVVIILVARMAMDAVIPRYVVDGASMEPSLHTSERVIVDRVSMLLDGPSRGDVVVLDSPSNSDLLIKRVVGLPNEIITLRAGRVYVNGDLLAEPYVAEFCTVSACDGTWVLGPDEYFVLGDNRNHSYDSHSFGPVPVAAINGIARVRYWPLDGVDILLAPDY
jgi:signal peptidase I